MSSKSARRRRSRRRRAKKHAVAGLDGSVWPRIADSSAVAAAASAPRRAPAGDPLLRWVQGLAAPLPATLPAGDVAVSEPSAINAAGTALTPAAPPRALRFMSVNAENMDRLIPRGNRRGGRAAALKDEQKQACLRLSRLIRDVNPDVFILVEGPSTPAQMQRFNVEYLSHAYAVLGGLDGGQQRVYCLVRRNGASLHLTARVPAIADEFFDARWKVDVTGDCVMTRYKYLRRPLIVEVEVRGPGLEPQRLMVIGLHLKSKHIPRARQLWETEDIDDKMAYIKKAVENRRRIAAEVNRCRQLIDMIMDDCPRAKIIIAGDVNDGPGKDLFEQRYLLSNASDALLGSPFTPNTCFSHTLLESFRKSPPQASQKVASAAKSAGQKPLRFRSGGVVTDAGLSAAAKGAADMEPNESKTAALPANRVWTIEFDDYVDGSVRKVLIDHVLVSPALRDQLIRSDVPHEAFKANCLDKRDSYADRIAMKRSDRPCDHRPIYADFEL